MKTAMKRGIIFVNFHRNMCTIKKVKTEGKNLKKLAEGSGYTRGREIRGRKLG
jgi:hypothetical protein